MNTEFRALMKDKKTNRMNKKKQGQKTTPDTNETNTKKNIY